MIVTGVIRAGGQSARMGGRPKTPIELGGRRIIDRVVSVVQAVLDHVLIVTTTPELYDSLGLPTVPDAFPGCGSLGGLYSGLAAAPGDAMCTVACDMPFLVPEVARLVIDRAGGADAVVPRGGDCYAKSCLDPMRARLRAGRLRIGELLDDVGVLAIPESDVARFIKPSRSS